MSTSFSLPKCADFPTVIFFGRMQKGENIARMFVFRSPSAPPSIHLASRESEICLKTRSGKKMKTRSPWPIFLNSFYFIQAWIFLFIWCHRLLFSWEIWLCALLLCCENIWLPTRDFANLKRFLHLLHWPYHCQIPLIFTDFWQKKFEVW